MDRSERARRTALDGALERHRVAVAEADRRAVVALQDAGFAFTSVEAARAFQGRLRAVERAQAEVIEMGQRATRKRTA